MAKVFISYRREDARWPAKQLYEALRDHLRKDEIFMDVDSIPKGVDFVQYLSGKVAACEIFLCLIGKDWLSARDESGGRRLDTPTDFVRTEVRAALERNVRVVPVLLDGARMPEVEELPADLSSLVMRNGESVNLLTFEADVKRLARGLGLGKGAGTPPWRGIVASAGIAALLGGGWWAWRQTEIVVAVAEGGVRVNAPSRANVALTEIDMTDPVALREFIASYPGTREADAMAPILARLGVAQSNPIWTASEIADRLRTLAGSPISTQHKEGAFLFSNVDFAAARDDIPVLLLGPNLLSTHSDIQEDVGVKQSGLDLNLSALYDSRFSFELRDVSDLLNREFGALAANPYVVEHQFRDKSYDGPSFDFSRSAFMSSISPYLMAGSGNMVDTDEEIFEYMLSGQSSYNDSDFVVIR